jgi:cell division protease FtsH
VLIRGSEIHGTYVDGRKFQTHAPNDPTLVQRLTSKGVTITVEPATDSIPSFVSLLLSWLPLLALIGAWIFLSRRMQGPGAGTKDPQKEIDALKRQVADLQRDLDRLRARDK